MSKAKHAMKVMLGLSSMGQPSFNWTSGYFKPVEPWRSRRKGGKGQRAK